MYSNTIQARIEATLKELYKVHDIVYKPVVMYTMYSNIRSYFIILDKDNKAQLLNAFNPRIVEHKDKLELDSVTESPRIYQEYFIKNFLIMQIMEFILMKMKQVITLQHMEKFKYSVLIFR